MDLLHHDLPNTKPLVAIDTTFIDELLAIASTVVEPKKSSKTGGKPTLRLLDLPTEILLSIFEHLNDGDLYTLAQLSRRLHHLALPIYLARKGMSPFTGELVLFDEDSEAVLRALSVALFRPTLRCVSCTFNFHRPVLRYVRGFGRLLERLEVLHEAHLDFSNLRRFGPRDVVLGGDGCAAVWGTEVEGVDVDWAKEFRVLLDAVLAKGCATLTVCLAGWTAPSTPQELASVISRCSWYNDESLVSFVAGVVRALMRKVKEMSGRPRIPKLRGTLETFNLHSAVLLQVELIPWTIRTLNTSSISVLSLRNLTIFPESWAVILPCISLPLLSFLSIDLCSIRHRDMTYFLQRHPHVQRLYLGRGLPETLSEAQLPTDFLCNVTHLSAVPVYLNSLLKPTGALPALKSVSIITRVRHGRHFDFGIMNNTLLPIVFRLLQNQDHSHGRARVALTLELSFESSSSDWMLLDAAPDTRPLVLMPHVSRIELHIGLYRLPAEVATRLPQWLGLFPGLRVVAMRSPSRDGPTEVGERLGFVTSIFRRCRGLELVGINGVERALDGWITDG